ncbi:MAG: DUF2849 domain-containing protein [Pseudomonadota bacterium]
MKSITANRLQDGAVVYLSDKDQWEEKFSCAAVFGDDEALDVLTAAQSRVGEIAGAYLIDIDDGAPTGRERLKESIRSKGPTVREDLGLQAEA